MKNKMTINQLVEMSLGAQVINQAMTDEEIDNIGTPYTIEQIQRFTKAAGIEESDFWDGFNICLSQGA